MIELLAGQQRQAANNRSTMVAKAPGRWQQLWESALDFRKVFQHSYQTIRHICTGFGRLGVALIAVDTKQQSVAGSVCLAARVGEPAVAIVGRHGLADLYVEGDPSLSLRHLAVIVHPPTSWEPSRLVMSLLDLRTGTRFCSEHGVRLDALVAEGPVFVQCGRYALLCLPLGDATDFPESAADAWELVPERHYVDAQSAHTEAGPRHQLWAAPPSLRGRSHPGQTCVTLVDGPLMARARLLDAGEPIAGYLTAVGGDRSRTVPVGARALGRGVLIGRHERCDQHDLLTDRYISRVHLMLRRVDKQLYAVDLASTGRSFLITPKGPQPIRLTPIEGPVELALVHSRARVSWQPVAGNG